MIAFGPSHITRQQTSALASTLKSKFSKHVHERLAVGLRARFYGVQRGLGLGLLKLKIAASDHRRAGK